MRAVIMEVSEDMMVVMTKEGDFKKIRSIQNAQIGEEINLTEPSRIWGQLSRYSAIAACFVLLFIGGVQVKGYYTPYGYMNIDINPSVQIEFNKFDRILNVKGLNGDGDKIVSEIKSVKNSKIENGVQALIEASDKNNYIKADTENDIMVSVYSPNQEKADKLKNAANGSVNKVLQARGKKAEIINELVSKDDLNRADLQNVSVGKLKLYEKAKEIDPNITIEDIKAKPVREIMKLIKEAKKEEKKQSIDDSSKDSSQNKEKLEEAKKPQYPNQPEKKDSEKPKTKQTFIDKNFMNEDIFKINKDFQINRPKIEDINKDKINVPKIKSLDDLRERFNKIKEREKEIDKLTKKKNQ